MKAPIGVAEEDLWPLMLANIRRSVMEEDRDMIVVFTGGEGVGKSTIAMRFGIGVHPGMDLERFENVVFDPEMVVDRLIESEPGDFVLFDEGGNGLFSRDAMTTENKTLTTVAMVVRARNVIWGICIPNLHWLDVYFREHRVALWVHVTKRGFAIVHRAKRSPYRQGVYWEAFLGVEFDDLPPRVRAGYKARKDSYLTMKLLKEREKFEKQKAKK